MPAPSPPSLPLIRLRLTFRAHEALRLPAYTGSAWRGAFGHALKRLVCVTHEATCPSCLLYRSCTYPYLFETPPDPGVGKLTRYTAAPHPFVLAPIGEGGALPAGAPLLLDVQLFGRGQRDLPYVIHALNQAGQRGLGTDRGVLQLLDVAQQTDNGHWQTIYSPGGMLTPLPSIVPMPPPLPKWIKVRLLTPLRLSHENRLVSQDRFRFALLFSSLLRRISLLMAFHTDVPWRPISRLSPRLPKVWNGVAPGCAGRTGRVFPRGRMP